MNKEYVKIKMLKVSQNIGEFYVGVAKAKEVIQICSAEERRVSWDDLEKYLGMQRPLSKNRVGEIQEYVKTKDATFPNSIILALKEGSFIMEKDHILVEKNKASSNILDGQHRLAGFSKEISETKDFELIITLFPDLSLEDQAYLFSVINTKQNKINSSLAQDLYEFAKLETPQKIVHNLTIEFNNNDLSPWNNLIKRLGKKGPTGEEILSQSTFAKGIIELICNSNHSYQIRDILKKSSNDRNSLRGKFNYKETSRVLWEPFIDKRDDLIFKVLKSYFQAIQETYPKEWGSPKYILTKTTGYNALMKLFKIVYLKGFKEKNLTKDFFKNLFEKAKTSGEVKDLTSSNYNPGGTGEMDLYRTLLKGMDLN